MPLQMWMNCNNFALNMNSIIPSGKKRYELTEDYLQKVKNVRNAVE